MDVFDQDMGRLRRHHDFHRRIDMHDARHARRNAANGRIDALFAFGLLPELDPVDGLIFRRQRGLLAAPYALGWVKSGAAGAPLTHWPFRSGYSVSSHACAALTVAPSAPANARAANEIRSSMAVLRVTYVSPRKPSLYHRPSRTASHRGGARQRRPGSRPG